MHDYRRLLGEGSDSLRPVASGAIVRLESPGTASDIHLALARKGLESDPSADPLQQTLHASFSQMVPPRAWALGWQALLGELASVMREEGGRWLQDPKQVATCFDKPAAREVIAHSGVPTPRQLGPISSFEDLRTRMRDAGVGRVFVKLRHGASATGCVAVASSRGRFRGVTTVALAREGGTWFPFNSLRLRRLDGEMAVARVVDLLSDHGMFAEAWVPKAVLGGRSVDLRVLVLDGALAHAVVRLGAGPMTNLHLGNQRAPVEALRDQMALGVWERIEGSCRAVAQAFAKMQYVGVDVAVTSGLRGHRVLEVNAFGDELNHVLHGGLAPHEAQVACLSGSLAPAEAA